MNSNIWVNDDCVIYVLCPANLKTGGTELLHQLVYNLNRLGKRALITYYYEGKYADYDNPTPVDFKCYVSEYARLNSIEDHKKNILVIPEICIGKHRKYKRIQKILWWLSVDNYKKSIGKLNRLKRYGFGSWAKHLWLNDYTRRTDIFSFDLHLFQSYFAKDYIKSLGIKDEQMAYLSDYINDTYFSIPKGIPRKDIVLYNPKKGIDFTKKIIEHSNDIEYKAIQNMSTQEVFQLMISSKVYIDFGNHPGKDRIPRESAMCGCCVITNRRGSANYHTDVPIPDDSKFTDDDNDIFNIIERIKECLNNYEIKVNEYKEYRDFIRGEKQAFSASIKDIFCK